MKDHPPQRHSATPGRNRRRIAGNTAALGVTSAVAVIPLWRIYESAAFVTLGLWAFCIGSVIAVLGSLRRWPAWAVAGWGAGAYLIAGVPLAIPGLAIAGVLPSLDGLVELLSATALAWKQLVTIVLPVGAYQALLVPALILILGSTILGLSAALRSGTAELGVLAPLTLFVAGIALGPATATAPIESGMALVAAVFAWLLWLRWERRMSEVRLVAKQSPRTVQSAGEHRFAAVRRLAAAAVVVAVAVASGTAATLAAPASASRDVLRTRVQQPFDPRDYPSPLSEFRRYLQPGLADTALLQVEGLPSGGRLRIATLDTYDGVVYSVGSDTVASASGSFTRLPFRLDQSTVAGEEVELSVTIREYAGVWLPGTGQLERIEFRGQSAAARSDSFFYNDNSGTGAVLSGLAEGDSYRARSVVPQFPEDIAVLRPGTAVLPQIGVVPEGLVRALEDFVPADASPGEALEAMIEGLKAAGYVSHGIGEDEPVSRSGHGADRIAQLFTDRPMLGDQEQYAVAASLMARQLGFPARVVLGFAPQGAGTPGALTVRGSDISAWIEVQVARGEWLPIDSTPPVRDVPASLPDAPTVVSRPQSVVPPPQQEDIEQRDRTPAVSAEQDPPPAPDPLLAFLWSALSVAGWTLLGLAIVAAPFSVVVLAKIRRRRLRARSSSPIGRIRGGWREFQDTAVDYGIAIPSSATRVEAAEIVGGMRPLVLASVVDRAVFAPGIPTAADAERVWYSVGELRASLARG
ncbi:MAG: hypothetical protein JWQ68_2217, partial [Cryobacterium sp.]|nr:hypothetical protein [Cryobacterium sp.]